MSLSAALSNALTGMTAASRGVELVSANVANARTEGYAPRELQLAAQNIGGSTGGVKIVGIERRVNVPLWTERRDADAAAARAETRADGLARIEAVYGDPTEAGSLSERLAAFEASMVEAASRTDSVPRLDAVVSAAADVVAKVRDISEGIQNVRSIADAAIATDVETINAAMAQIQELDDQIFGLEGGDSDVTALLDQRQAAIDRIAPIVPVTVLQRDGGRIALVTDGGGVLYDGRPVALGFDEARAVTPYSTLAGGELSGLTLGGVDIQTSGAFSQIRGGRLAANFELRDSLATEAQTAIDAFARDLVERFQDPAVDATLGPTDAGLFTDSGTAFAAADEIGIADRIELNALVDPYAGGESWRMRDGLGAAAPGDVGDASLLIALRDALATPRAPASGPLVGLERTSSEHAADILSSVASARQVADASRAFQVTRRDGLREQELAGGVDTDEELRKLLTLEQAYAANARLIQTVDELMQSLLRI